MKKKDKKDTKSKKVRTPYQISSRLFIRFLGVIYLLAFGSLWSQVIGLIGQDGIMPASLFLERVSQNLGSEKYFLLPSIFWLNVSDLSLHIICGLGLLFSILLIIGLIPAVSSFFLWLFYLSIFSIGQDFLGFQWDILLIEVGFLAIFLSPWDVRLNSQKERAPKIIVILLQLVLFKVMIQSGLVKLLSGDQTWRDLTALNYHYMTQPIPNPISWYVHQWPEWFQKLSCIGMFIIELGMPVGIFIHRQTRMVSAFAITSLMVLVIFTGNYNFFNLLVIALSILCFDDQFMENFLSLSIPHVGVEGKKEGKVLGWRNWLKRIVGIVLLCVILTMSVHHIMRSARLDKHIPEPVTKLVGYLSSLRICNSYGLFAIMTVERPEIIIEGSNDNKNWQTYEFHYKPGDLKRRPPQVAPHQPRLDWQMWFAALGRDFRSSPWIISFMQRLLEGSDQVEGLLKVNPFEEEPPKFIRAEYYLYDFTTAEEKRTTGQWWKREYVGRYSPVITLSE